MLLAALIAALAAWAVGGSSPEGPRLVGGDPAATVRSFLRAYMTADGRIVRWDQGGDTVSEGQAYGLLMTAVTGDRRDFLQLWGWTQAHLSEPNGLLAWRWAGGRVVGSQPASDGDLGTAAALAIAAGRFGDASLLASARRMASAIVKYEVTSSNYGPVLVAGPWAVTPTTYVDPSYLAPAEMGELARAFGSTWNSLASSTAEQLEALTSRGQLPPDWAAIGSDGRIRPSAPPASGGEQPRFGYDAARTPIWMSTSCNSGVRSAAAALLPALDRGKGEVELDLRGKPSPGQKSPLGLLAWAGAQEAAGHSAQAAQLLSKAAKANEPKPTYYSSAWVVLADLAFNHLLGGCG